ncbi:Protein MAIN-LIKE 1 [Glycine soja]
MNYYLNDNFKCYDCLNVHIMVRTRGLGRSLSRVIGRALRREVSCDSDEAPERRRPTASALASVVEDVQHVDDVADEVHEQHEEATNDDVVIDIKGFSSGPHNTSILSGYVHHVAVTIWNGEEHPELKLSFHGRKVKKFNRPPPEIKDLVIVTGLSPLIACSLETSNRGLISAFAESFHLPVGEVIITLDDVTLLLHLPIIGTFYSFEALHMDKVVFLLVELLEVSSKEARAETVQCHGPYVRLLWLQDTYRSKCDVAQWTIAARAYLLHLVGCTLFANKSATHVYVATALVHRYKNLNDASKSNSRQLARYIIVFQCWIYEHFPFVALFNVAEDYHERKPCACRWKSGKALPISTVVRQFGYVQTIPPHPAAPTLCIEDIDGFSFLNILHRWVRYVLCLDSVQLTTWNAPGGTTAMDEALVDAPAHVEQPQHAVACQTIAERLERLINLRIVTNGTETYVVTKNCLRIARGVTTKCNVYVQS